MVVKTNKEYNEQMQHELESHLQSASIEMNKFRDEFGEIQITISKMNSSMLRM